jgi:hypothetical protein
MSTGAYAVAVRLEIIFISGEVELCDDMAAPSL